MAEGWRSHVIANTTIVDVVTPAGLYLGRTGQFEFDAHRLNRVVARTARGLFLYEFKRRLPPDYGLRVLMVHGLSPEQQSALPPLVAPIIAQPPRVFGGDVFSYRVAADPDEPNATGWLLTFFESFHFVAVTESRTLGQSNSGTP